MLSVNPVLVHKPEIALAGLIHTLPDVLTSMQIRADLRRILYALVTPEYLEAWLELPKVERIECHSEKRSFDKFRIDLFSSGKRTESIFGSCYLTKPNRVTYLWEREFTGLPVRSVIEIRIHGGPAEWSLNLCHSGLTADEEFEWHSALWRSSLKKLRTLIEGIRAEPMNHTKAEPYR